jgi:hypothetical protein
MQAPIGANRPEIRLPEVSVGVNETWHHDGARSIDDLAVSGLDSMTHCRDVVILYQNVGTVKHS